MRALLINPNRMKPAVAPIALDYLADSVLRSGHEALLLDLCFEESPLAALEADVTRASPDVIAVSIRNTDDCYFGSQAFFLPEVRGLLARLRHLSPAPLVLGGVGFSVAPAAILRFCGADFGIAGDGEVALVHLLDALEHHHVVTDIPSLCYVERGAVRRNPVAHVDLAQLPPRQRAFIDNRRYFIEGGQAGFETKRGCPMPCSYCADPIAKGRSIRTMPPAGVVYEIQRLFEQGLDHLHTCDSEFNLPPEHALAVCEEITRTRLGDRIRWYAYCTPLPFSDDLAAAFKQAGCAGINFGVDSGSDHILARLGRHFRATDLERAAAICRRHQIPFMFDLLLGSPGETLATLSETIDRMKRIGPDCVGLSLGVRLYPGTTLAERLRPTSAGAEKQGGQAAADDEADLLAPVFHVSPEIGPDFFGTVRALIAGDPRFFLPAPADAHQGYNYNDNQPLVDAIRRGARGAYWDILRQLRPVS